VAGLIRTARRPPGWLAPGPQPLGDRGRPELQPADDEDLSFLTGDWRVFQKLSGHRWSLDDLVCADVAATHASELGATRHLDMGCGLGSVLLMMAWRFPQLEGTGIEAQADRAELARRSIDWNGARCRVITGDLRDANVLPEGTRFPIVTGTPPYFPQGTGPESEKSHAAACRFELRGGIEEYVAAAVRFMEEKGRFVVVTAALEERRVVEAARVNGLHVIEHLDVVPREGKGILAMVDVMSREGASSVRRSVTVRDSQGQWTEAFQAVRERWGFPPRTTG
jgi:tRNA1(Val) A37 N6-methylase TrmN6